MSIHECYPYLRVDGAARAVAWYLGVYGGREVLRLVDPSDGRLGHVELELAPGKVLMLSDPYPEYGVHPPSADGRPAMALHLHVDDADAVIAAAVEAGAALIRPATDMFYGERSGVIRDPFGHEWMIGHEIEKVDADEMQRRWDAMGA